MKALAIVFVALLAALPVRAGTENLRLVADGLERRAVLHVPDGIATPAPLVLVIHGFLQTPEGYRRVTRGNFEALAQQNGFVVAYPEGLGRDWDFGEGGRGARLVPLRDDTAFLAAVVDAVDARVPIDRRRVFAAGSSLGATMAYALACKRPGLIRAVASVNMPFPEAFLDDCRAAPPFGLLAIQGTGDIIMPASRALVAVGMGPLLQTLGHEETLAYARSRNGCPTAPTFQRLFDEARDGTRVWRRDWSRCPGGAVQSFLIEDGGHTWPGGRMFLPFLGKLSREIDGAAAAYAFFAQFR